MTNLEIQQRSVSNLSALNENHQGFHTIYNMLADALSGHHN